MESKRVKLIKKYLSKNGRLDKYLTQLVKLYHEKPTHKALNIFLKKPLTAIAAFKCLILLQTLICEESVSIPLCSMILQGITFSSEKDFDSIISQKYLNPYRLFLQKRCQIDLNKEPNSTEEREALIFQLLNIIKASSTFQQVIYIFGRYFSQKCKFIIDFNIILAKDISKIYKKLQQKCPLPYTQAFLQEVELIHEVMYPIYFNNYFFLNLRAYKPKWIQTESKSTTDKKKYQTNEKASIKKQCYLDSTAGESHDEERSCDAISVQLEEVKEEQEYLVGQFDPFEEQLTKEQLLLKPSADEVHYFFEE